MACSVDLMQRDERGAAHTRSCALIVPLLSTGTAANPWPLLNISEHRESPTCTAPPTPTSPASVRSHDQWRCMAGVIGHDGVLGVRLTGVAVFFSWSGAH